MACMPPLDEVDRAARCVCLRWASAGSAEERHDVEKEQGDGDVVAAGEWLEVVLF